MAIHAAPLLKRLSTEQVIEAAGAGEIDSLDAKNEMVRRMNNPTTEHDDVLVAAWMAGWRASQGMPQQVVECPRRHVEDGAL